MLPRPATTRWSLNAALSEVLLPAQAFASIAASNSFPSGSGPSARSSGSCSSLARGEKFLEPKASQQRLLFQFGSGDKFHRAEAARVIERHRCAIRHVKHHVIMRAATRSVVMVIAGGTVRADPK